MLFSLRMMNDENTTYPIIYDIGSEIKRSLEFLRKRKIMKSNNNHSIFSFFS